MKKNLVLCCILLLMAFTAAIWADLKSEQQSVSVSGTASGSVTALGSGTASGSDTASGSGTASSSDTASGSGTASGLDTASGSGEGVKEVTEVSYQQDGYDAVYPMILAGGTEKQLEQWNRLITGDFEKILSIYSFRPFSGPTITSGLSAPAILKLGYELKENSDRFFSVFYMAQFSSRYVAHPTELVYTTNIDKGDSKRIRLGDYVRLDRSFVKDFRTWNIIPFEEGNEELNTAIKDYLAGLSDEELLRGMKEADQIGSANLYQIYSYHTPEVFGISLGVPNYLGDHIEFEKKITDLGNFLQEGYR